MPPRTQNQIMDFLDRRPSASAEEISQGLNLTKENIQYHLKLMLREGQVERTASSAGLPTPRGRPTYRYCLSKQSRPGDIPALADKLLEVVLTGNTPLFSPSDLFRQMAASMFPYQPSRNPTQHLRQTIQRLDQHHYQPSWEARAAGPYVYFRNCPYAAIIKNHPELCQLDCAILVSLLNAPVTQLSKMDLDSRKPPACIFLVQP